MDKLPIILWSWGDKFSFDYIMRMRNMLGRHLHMPHRIVVISDNKDTRVMAKNNGMDTVKLWSDLADQGGKCLVRLKCFDESFRAIIPEKRWAWFDLDMVLVDDVTPIFSRPEPFIMSGVELGPQPVNGSLVIADHGVAPEIFTQFDRALWQANVKGRGLKYGGSDQAWIAIKANDKITKITREDGLFSYRDDIELRSNWAYADWVRRNLVHALQHEPTGGPLPKGARIIQMNGPHSPWRADKQARSPWIKHHWK